MRNYVFMSAHTLKNLKETSTEIPCGAPMLSEVFDVVLAGCVKPLGVARICQVEESRDWGETQDEG